MRASLTVLPASRDSSCGERVEIALDEIGEAVQQSRALVGRRRGPGGRGALRGGDRGVDVGSRRNRGSARTRAPVAGSNTSR